MNKINSLTKSAVVAAVALLLLCSPSIAAEKKHCTEASVLEVQGRWASHSEKDVDVEQSKIIPQSEWPAVKKRTDVYAELIRQALGDIKGYDAVTHPTVGGALFKDGPAMYRSEVYMYDFLCLNGILHGYLDKNPDAAYDYGDTTTAIQVNGVWDMAGPEAGYVINGKHYYLFGSPIGEIRGFPAFERGNKWVVLVSKPGKFPFVYASRKEVLDELRARNEQERAKGLKIADSINVIRPQAVQDKDREKELALFLKGAKDDQQRQKWTERFNKDYRTDEQKRDEARKKFTGIYDKIRARLDAVEARYTQEQLKETAMTTFSETNFRAFEDFDFKPTKQEAGGTAKSMSGDYFGKPYALPHRAYFDAGLPRSVPQFFAVSFEWEANKTSQKRRDDFFARFDFDKLVSLLGK